MRIERVRVRDVALRLAAPIRTATGEITERSGCLIELWSTDGSRGVGEALPLPAFGGESGSACRAALLAAARPLLGAPCGAPELPSELEVPLADAPVARAACETAWVDLVARASSRPAERVLGSEREPPCESLPLNALLVARSPAALEREARAATEAGYRTLKLKVGALSLEADLARARAVRRAAPAPLRLRLDANGAWSPAEAERALCALAELEPEWVEQPIAPGDVPAFVWLHAACGGRIRLAADESAARVPELEALLEAGAVDAVAIKLPTLGGPLRARRIACRAAAAGIEVAVTSFLDSTLGCAAAARVAASLPRPPAACGLATTPLLVDDLAAPLRIADGRLWLPQAPGLVPEPDEDRLARLCGKTRVDASLR